MFDPDDPDRPVKAFLLEYQTPFGFGPEALDERRDKLTRPILAVSNSNGNADTFFVGFAAGWRFTGDK